MLKDVGKKMVNESFGGDKKLPMNSLLARYEHRLIDGNVRRFPDWIEGYHLTLTTLLWSIGLIIFGWLARNNYYWLWGSSIMLFLQWFTDSFDGALGRYRDTGIPKWGYYMDHFLDFVFMSSVLIGYSFLLDGSNRQIVYLLIPVHRLRSLLRFRGFLPEATFLCKRQSESWYWRFSMAYYCPS